MKELFWKIAELYFFLSVCSAARNYADYDHDYTDASDQDNYDTLSSWVVGIIVSICFIVVVIVVLLVVCCLCCSKRKASTEGIAHSTGNGTVFLTAFTSQYSVPSKSIHPTGCTNAVFTVTEESNVQTQCGPQIIAPPPPYSEHHDDSSEEVAK